MGRVPRPPTPTSPTCYMDEYIFVDLDNEDREMSPLKRQSLCNNWEWKQRRENVEDLEALASQEGWTPTSIPTEVFKDLLDSGLIADPFLDRNEDAVQWVGEADWVYRTKFPIERVPGPGEKAALVLEGLDTFASVYLNGKLILTSKNMFHEHRVDVSRVLKAGSNDLAIVFESALKRGRAEVAEKGYLICWNGEPSRLYVRKAQYHWGWDWGPVMMSAGPWKPIHLEVYQSRIEEIYFPVELSDDLSTATMDYSITLESPPPGGHIRISIQNPGDKSSILHVQSVPANQITKGSITIKNPRLWYPVNQGPQTIYTLTVSLSTKDTILDSKSQPLAFRRAKLIQRPLSNEEGFTFLFEINNIPTFCAGSNWIPADNILTRLSPEDYKRWLSLLVGGGQNMVRVWGGGVYESDAFYEECDRLGIMVWQDFMFACGQYPCHPSFRESVETEARQQVQRLRVHPCVVLFAGNNEDYQIAESAGLQWNPEEMDTEKWLKSDFPARYLYEKTLPDVVCVHGAGIAYHPGSPWGKGKPTRDPTVGDIHQWNVWHGNQEPYQSYPQLGGRFVSEFGMQALPSPRTLKYFLTDPTERYPQSRTMDHHNKAAGFERRLGAYVLENLRLQTFELDEYARESQRMQSDALAMAYRGWRRGWCGSGKESVAGALVWQSNDCWPCTSWSIVDYFFRPKMAWYAIGRELRDVTFGIARAISKSGEKATSLDVWGVNSTLSSHGIDLKLELFSIQSGKILLEKKLESKLLPNQSTEILTALDISNLDVSDVVASVVYKHPVTGQILRSSADWPQPLKYIHFPNRQVEFSVHEEDVRVRAAIPTKSIILDIDGDDDEGVTWSDNGFDMMPGETVVVHAKGMSGRKVLLSWYGGT